MSPLPDDVLADVARVVGAPITAAAALPGGINGGSVRIRLGGMDAVLKALPRAHPDQLDGLRLARAIAEQLRGVGYPTPAWLGIGATERHVWQLTDFVDATPARVLDAELLDQLMAIIELQADQACVDYDHWRYAWRVATASSGSDQTPEQVGLRQRLAQITDHSPAVAALVERATSRCRGVPAPTSAPDAVHADVATPSNVLVRDGIVVALVDIGNAGSGTRAIDLVTLIWPTYADPTLTASRRQLWTRVLEIVDEEQAAVLASSHLMHMLELALRQQPETLDTAVTRGHRFLDELTG